MKANKTTREWEVLNQRRSNHRVAMIWLHKSNSKTMKWLESPHMPQY
jgi:hypothetical protein